MRKIFKMGCGCLSAFFGCILLLSMCRYVYCEWIWEEWPAERIERITGVEVPEFIIVERHEREKHFTGDYMDTFVIEFDTMPSEEMFDKIDDMISTGNTSWEREGDEYSFSTFWGNGYPAPKGESEGADGIFGITVTRGKKVGTIRSGSW